MKNLLIIAGPTASGKTALAVEVAAKLHGEVVSADSMQVYRGMDILSAKPSPDEMQGVPHHMLSVAEPGDSFSCGAYRKMAAQVIEDLFARGKQPILAGGTGLYIDSLTRPLSLGEASNAAVRENLTRIASEDGGRDTLYQMLERVDPERAARLHPNDVRRVMRAIEIFETTGMTQSEKEKADRAGEPLYRGRLFIPDWDREELYRRIDRRCEDMFRRGLPDEVRRLMQVAGDRDTSFQAIGFKEVAAAIRGECSMDDALESVKRATRNYAKRQLTWFRRDERAVWIPCAGRSVPEIAGEIIKKWESEHD